MALSAGIMFGIVAGSVICFAAISALIAFFVASEGGCDIESGVSCTNLAWRFSDSMTSVNSYNSQIKQFAMDYANDKGSDYTKVEVGVAGNDDECELKLEMKAKISVTEKELKEALEARFHKALKAKLIA